MSGEIITALVALAVTVITALGTLVKLLIDRLRAELEANTRLTTQARDLVNGNYRDTLEQLATERNRSFGLRVALREREDRLAYILARHPDVETTLDRYLQMQTRTITTRQELEALDNLLNDDLPAAGEEPGA